MTPYTIGWLAGILEGEGTFGYYSGTQRVAIEMADEDVVVDAARMIGEICGDVFVVAAREKHHRVNQENWTTLYRLQITGKNARTLMKFIVPHMSKRRRAKIWQSLNGYTEPKLAIARDNLNVVVLKRA